MDASGHLVIQRSVLLASERQLRRKRRQPLRCLRLQTSSGQRLGLQVRGGLPESQPRQDGCCGTAALAQLPLSQSPTPAAAAAATLTWMAVGLPPGGITGRRGSRKRRSSRYTRPGGEAGRDWGEGGQRWLSNRHARPLSSQPRAPRCAGPVNLCLPHSAPTACHDTRVPNRAHTHPPA